MSFLDNVKVLLTILVVSHHVACGFGACGDGWFLVIGNYNEKDYSSLLQNLFLKGFVIVNQSYFMPLFFLISAYFIPTSYDKKGNDGFLQSKRKRLYIPAIFT